MFGAADRETQEIARVLYDRAKDAASKYLKLPAAELGPRIVTDFPAPRSYAWADEVGFYYEDEPDFAFHIYRFSEPPFLSIQAGGPYWGFMLQQSGDTWFTDVRKPLIAPIGPRAKRLAASLQRQFGVQNIGAKMARIRGRFQ